MNGKKKKLIIISIFFTSLLLNFVYTPIRQDIISNNNFEKEDLQSSATASLLWNFTARGGVPTSAALADIDNDGKLEVMMGSADSYMYALNSEDGTLVWESNPGGAIWSSPTLGDIDGDGKLEIVFGTYGNHLYALNSEDGSELWRFPTGDAIATNAVLADLDGDNKLEAVFGCVDDKVYVLNGEDGSLLWNYTTGGDIYSSPAVGDLNGDGTLEVAIGSRDHKIYVFHGENGSVLWSYESDYWNPNSPAIGDFDLDGDLEVTISFVYGLETKVYSFYGDNGSVHWIYEKTKLGSATAALADIDEDGYLEVVLGNHLVLNAEDGSVYFESITRIVTSSETTLADVDGDGKLEAVCVSDIDAYEVHALSFDTNTTEWTFYAGYYVHSLPVVEDIDGDGELEVIFGCYNHQIYALDITPSGSEIAWQGRSGDLMFQRWKNTEWEPPQVDLPPICNIELLKNGKGITEIDINNAFNINVAGSFDDHEIIEVRFSSDDEQDGSATGTWTGWYDWDSSSGNWDASTKDHQWSFSIGGDKELWAEIKDNNSQTTRNHASLFVVYNITKDSRFSVLSYFDEFVEFGEVELNIRLSKLTSNGDDDAFREALEEWGINLYDFPRIMTCVLLEVGDFNKVFDYLEQNTPNLFTPSVRSFLEHYLSDDGYIRFTFTLMSNIEDLSFDLVKQLVEHIIDNWKPKELIKIPYALFKTFEPIFRTFFKTVKGSNQYYFRCYLKPEIKKGEFILKFLLNIAKNFNVELHRLNIQKNSITAITIIDLKPLIDIAEKIYDIFKLLFKTMVVLIQGGTNILSDIKLGAKAVSFIIKHLLHHEFQNFGHPLDYIYIAADFIDPPIARLDLQITDAETHEILLGYDPSTNTTSYVSTNGFYRGDLESQFALIHISQLPINVSVINTHLESIHPLIYLNQSLNFGMLNSTDGYSVFSYVQSNNSFFSIINYTGEHGLIFNQLKVSIMEQGYSWVKINISDSNNNAVQNTDVEVFLRDTKLNSTIVELSEGVYNISVAFEYTNEDLLIIVEKLGYFSNSVDILLGSLEPLEEEATPLIPGFSMLILFVSFLGISTLLIILRYRKKYLRF